MHNSDLTSHGLIIIDYGMGNIGSIINIVKHLGFSAEVSSNPEVIKRANKVILPGVGHFEKAIEALNQGGLKEAIIDFALVQKKPILGICLGMQLMCTHSEEGNAYGLDLIHAHVKRFKSKENLKVPHMGWNTISLVKESSRLFAQSLLVNPKFYFVHSYFVECKNEEDVSSTAHYGEKFTASFERENIFGVQFHPEKSHSFGMRMFQNFLSL